jgi:hypothetical protein
MAVENVDDGRFPARSLYASLWKQRELIRIANLRERDGPEVIPGRASGRRRRVDDQDAATNQIMDRALRGPLRSSNHARQAGHRRIDLATIVSRKRRQRGGVAFQPGR